MGTTESKAGVALVLSLPTSAALLVLFFMPWLKVSCDPRASELRPPQVRLNSPDGPGALPMPELPDGPVVVAQASGWQLARGEASPVRNDGQAAPDCADGQTTPTKRIWAYGGLALPAGVLAIGLAGLMGGVSRGGAGRVLLLLGAAGLLMTSMAASVEYSDDLFDTPRLLPAGGPSPCAAAVSRAKTKARQCLATEATPYLWASLGLYVFVAGSGLVGMGAPRPASARSAAAAVQSRQFDWRTTAAPGDEASPRPRRPYRTTMPMPVPGGDLSSIGPPPPPLERDNLPAFGPDVEPLVLPGTQHKH